LKNAEQITSFAEFEDFITILSKRRYATTRLYGKANMKVLKKPNNQQWK